MAHGGPIDLGASLRDRVVLVTGGLGGIGRACIERFSVHGALVAFTFADGIETAEVAAGVAATDPERRSAHPLDLRSTASIEACLESVLERWGRAEVLVNNAAVGSATVAALSDDPAVQDRAMLDVNAAGTLALSLAFIRAAEGRPTDLPRKIISVSSVGGGVAAFPGFRVSDGMSKAAVAHMTRHLAAELVDAPFDVMAICPGATDTPMFRASTLDALDDRQRAAFLSRLPKGRAIAADEIADLIVVLASGLSTALHGAVIDASMGLGVRPGRMTERPAGD